MTFSTNIKSTRTRTIYNTLRAFFITYSLFFVSVYSASAQGCGSNVLDPGGVGNYPNDQNWVETYSASTGNILKVEFVSFNTEASYDFLYIYDGPSINSPLLATLHGTTIPNDIFASGNQITLNFTSDGSVVSSGFELNIVCTGSSGSCIPSDCAEEYSFEWYNGSSGAQWPISNGEASISNVYNISGGQGDYNVTVTLNNPDGQNIDFSNCTSIPDAAYTATCNDPNGNTECDGDPNTNDTQFTYGCSFLTFGVTSQNSDQTTSITYDFEYPAYLCDFEIGDIDFSPASNPDITSYQDEVDVTADSMGIPVVLSAVNGSAVEVFNNNTSSIKLLADYDNVTGGDLLPTDPRGRVNISSLSRVTSVTFTYSNGPEDDGLSDDHAIRLDGFSFCPTLQEICNNGIDDDGDGYIDDFDANCPSYAPFNCDKSLYQSIAASINADYFLYETSTNPVALNSLYNLSTNGMTGSGFNSLAFNPRDRFLYGINPNTTGNNELYRINANGEVQDLGSVIGLSGTNEAGCMGPNGEYYVSGLSEKLFSIDIVTLQATEIADIGFTGSDMAMNPKDGQLYLWDSNNSILNRVDPLTGSVNSIGSANTQYGALGALYFNEQGQIIAYGDDTYATNTDQETLLKIDPITGVVTSLGNSVSAIINDGCSCAFGIGFDKAVSSTLSSAGDELTYTFTIHNQSTIDLSNVTFSDLLPAGISWSSEPYEMTGLSIGSTSITGQQNASFIISMIPSGGTSTFKINASVSSSFCGIVSNQAELTDLPTYFGSNLLSDDPSTAQIIDPTITNINNCAEYFLEVECATVGSNWNEVLDPLASGGSYLTINPPVNSYTTAPSAADDIISFSVDISDEGLFNLFARVRGASYNDDSFWLRVNGGTWYMWNSWSPQASSWAWVQSYNSEDDASLLQFNLSSGINTIDIAYREDGSHIDKIALVTDNTAPTGLGGDAYNCPEICGNGIDDDNDGLTDCEDGDCGSEANCQGPCAIGSISVQQWFGISGSAVSDLTSNINYPNSPDSVITLSNFQAPNNYADNYGSRIAGYIIPSETGNYTFNVTGDDGTEVRLSSSNDPLNMSLIAHFTGWTSITQHDKYATQTSSSILLQAGVWYFVEVLHKEGAGGDHLQLYWQTPSNTNWTIIPGSNLAPESCVEICDNGIDDDGDMLIDCLDPDCAENISISATTANNTICLGDSTILSAVASNATTYIWESGDTPSNIGAGIPDITISPIISTSYVITVTNSSGCTATSQVDITVDPLPNANAGADQIICKGESTTLIATGGVSYEWDDSSSNSSRKVTPDSSITYTVTVTGSNGCTSIDHVTVDLLEVDGGIVSGDEINCSVFNGSDILSYESPSISSGTYTIKWQQSSDQNIWSDIAGETGLVYSPGTISTTTYFRRVVENNICISTYSNVIAKIIDPTSPICFDEEEFAYPCAAGYRIEPIGQGIKNTVDPKLGVYNSQFYDYYIVEAVFSGGANSPDQIVFTTLDGETKVINKKYFDGESGLTGNRYFKGIFAPSDSVFLSHQGDASLQESFVIYAVSSAENYESLGKQVHQEISPGETVKISFPVSAGINSKEVFSSINLAGIQDDGSEIIIRTYGGGVFDTTIVTTPNNNNTLSLEFINLEDLSNVTDSIHFEIESPSVNGQTALLSGYVSALVYCDQNLVITAETDTECVREGDTISYNYTLYNFADIEFSDLSGTSSLGGTIDFGATIIPANTQLVVSQDIVITNDMIVNPPLINNIFVSGYNYSEFGTEPKSDRYLDSLVICEICDDGLDNDEDGFTDCLDPDCTDGIDISSISATDSEICIGDSTTITVNTSGAISYQWDFEASSNTIVDDEIILSVSPMITTIYTITVTNSGGCTASDQLEIIVNTPQVATASNDGPITCNDPTVTITASSSGVDYLWSNGATSRVTDVTSGGEYSVTITDSNGCTDTTTTTVTEIEPPIITLTGPNEICIGETTNFTPSSGGEWTSSNESVAVISNNGNVVGVSGGFSIFTFTASIGGCTAVSDTIFVSPEMAITIDYIGGVCLTDDSQLGVNITGGTPSYTYSWTGPNSFTSTDSIIDLSESGNYYVTVTDAFGCEESISGYVYQSYDAFILTLETEVCEGETVDLSVNSSTAISYIWSANAGSATSTSVTVTPTVPASTYTVTITNDQGCEAEATITIDVIAKTDVEVTGNTTICKGETTTLSPSSGGTWSSSNNALATVTTSGVVTGLMNGSVSFIFTDSITNCSSDPTTNVTILDLPNAIFIGPNVLCEGESTSISPTSGGEWTSSDTDVATITNNGIITAVGEGTATFIFKNTITDCTSNESVELTIHPILPVAITGDTTICEGENTYLSPTSGGEWISSNTEVATVNNLGVVTGVGNGTAYFTFQSSYTCTSPQSATITVTEYTDMTIQGSSEVCEEESQYLTADVAGGTWSSSNTSLLDIDASTGAFTAHAAGSVTITYTQDSDLCINDAIHNITIRTKPDANVTGSVSLCIGEISTVVSTETGGTWTSTNDLVAIVSGAGEVVGVNPGQAAFIYETSHGCFSDTTAFITVNPELFVDISFSGSVCLDDNTQLTAEVSGGSPDFIYKWTGPGGFTSTDATIDVPLSGNYTVLVTDSAGCSDSHSAFVYQRYEPFIFTLNTEICEGENITLGINGSNGGTYQWSANAGGSTDQSITVTPPIPSATYMVTVTNDIGCTTVASATIDVNSTPSISLTGEDNICVGNTTTLSSSSSGTWVSSDYNVASINNNGEVIGVNPGAAVFTFIDDISGCYSAESETVTVIANSQVTISGDDDLCIGTPEVLTASETGGTWTSNNAAIATIDPNSGVVTPLTTGTVDITYTMPAHLCYDQAFRTIFVRNLPSVNVNGPSTICEGDITYLLPSSGGTWVSDDESVATVSNIGVITGISGGTASFTFSSDFGCVKTLGTPITVIAKPEIAVSGPTELCIYESTNLTSNVNGIWTSSNNQVASVNSQGTVTANRQGVADFTFVEFTNGCQAASQISITINGVPTINDLSDPVICIGETTSITPSTGGYWTSRDTTIAQITDNGIITGVGAGATTFIYEDADTGCKSLASSAVTVEGNPTIILPASTTLCVGETSNILPATGGLWTSSDVSIATIDNQGNIIGMSEGTVYFTYTNASTGCVAYPSEPFTINNPANSSITGQDGLCIGETVTLISSDLGNWSSSNPAVGNVTNTGQFTAVAPGVVTITLHTFDLCMENPTIDIQVNPAPITNFLGTSSLCIGSTTNLHPSSGGTWISSNESIATVTDEGLVTAIAEGNAQFTYTDAVTMCTSTNATLLNVFGDPEVEVAGDTEICIGGSTSMFPSSGGLWTSTNDQVASISNSGEVTGISAGQVSFIYTETESGCISENSNPITVMPKPLVSITGDSQLCINETSTLSSSTEGSWMSDNPLVASVTENGVVTALSQGLARFTFISNAGCTSQSTSPVIVYGAPTIIISDSDLCINETIQISPSSGGTWTTLDESIATITENGVVTGISAGSVSFVFTDSTTGCISEESDEIIVNPAPDIDINGPAEICTGTTTNLVPTSGGLWTSLDPSVASIDNEGVVTGVSAGNARFIFAKTSTGCYSDTSDIVTVLDEITPVYLGDTEVCVGDTSYIIPHTGGIWTSTDESIATITNEGMIIGISQGIAQFEFSGQGANCSSTISSSFIVNGATSITLTGSNQICIGGTSQLSSGSPGTWSSLNPTIASIDNMGVISGLVSGVAHFVFTDANTGCESDGSISIEVVDNKEIDFSESSEVCVGYTIQMLPSSGGTWISNDPAVATITNSGVVTGKAAGKTTFQFTDTNTGCITNDPTKIVSVNNCINHDFNVTLVNQEITGNLSTNDYMDAGTTYSSTIQTVEKPESGLVSLVVSSDGSYVFKGSRPGNYLYKIPVCGSSQSVGCPTRLLEITVLDDVYSNGNSAANIDIATVYTSTDGFLPSVPLVLDVMANDKCVFTGGCDMDYSSVSIVSPPKHGTASVDLLGNILYSSDVGYIGYDTLCYQTCTDGNNHCNRSWQMISVKKSNADNSVIGSDDFNYTLVGIPISGNVKINDKDPEGDNVSIVPQGSLMAPVMVRGGSFFIDALGDYTFTPYDDFSGSTEIIYTLCDDNVDVACRNATIHVLVFDDIALKIRVYIEGALMNNNDETTSLGKPMMTDYLRKSPFNGENSIPELDPYSVAFSSFSDLPSKYNHSGPHLITGNTTIAEFNDVMTVTGDNAIVDWIHVELRSKDDMTDAFASRSGLLQRDGDIVDLDGVSPLRFQGINVDSFYVVVKHRSHLGVMSQKVHFGTFVDFTDNDFPIFDFGTTKDDGYDYSGLAMKEDYKSGYRACWAGDLDSNGKIKFSAPSDDQVFIYQDVLFSSPEFLINYDFALGYYTGDFDMNGKAKYENPNDDKNYLFAQLLFYPLNTNFLSNFDFFIQQIPEAK